MLACVPPLGQHELLPLFLVVLVVLPWLQVVLPPSEPTSEHVFIPPSEDAWRNSRDSRKGGASLARYVVSGAAAFGE
jgi:hypothetical protein